MALEFEAAAATPTPPFSITGTPYYFAMFNAAGDNVVDSNFYTTAAKEIAIMRAPLGTVCHFFTGKNNLDENAYSQFWTNGNAFLGLETDFYLLRIAEATNTNYAAIGIDKVTTIPFISFSDNVNSKFAYLKNNNGLTIDGGSGIPLKWPLADGTAGQVMKTDGAGVLGFQYPFMAIGNIPLLEYSFKGGIFEDLASGNNDLYTVPAGKKAVVLEPHRLYNNTGGSVSSYSQIKISGTYYRLGLAISQGANSGGNVTFNNSIVLNAGESYSINTGSTGQSVFVSIVEFSDAVPVKRIGSFALASGDNTIYTVPANKKAALITFSSPGLNAGASTRMVNTSGGSVTYTPYSIESGQAKAAKYQNEAAAAVGNNAQSTISFSPQLSDGDYLLINSTSGTAGQTIFGTVIEIDA